MKYAGGSIDFYEDNYGLSGTKKLFIQYDSCGCCGDAGPLDGMPKDELEKIRDKLVEWQKLVEKQIAEIEPEFIK